MDKSAYTPTGEILELVGKSKLDPDENLSALKAAVETL